MVENFDSIIIGTGQGGPPLATFLTGKGEHVAVIERSFVGGTCVNYGCTPTKTLIATARIAHLNRTSSLYGINHGPVSIDFKSIQNRKHSVVLKSRSGSEQRLKDDPKISFIAGSASFTSQKEIFVKEVGSDFPRNLSAPKIFIDTGTESSLPPIPGLDSVPYFDSKSLLEIDELPHQLVILGGSYIALEFAQLFSRLGSKVCILERDEFLLPREDEDTSTEINNLLQKEGILIYTGVDIIAVDSENEFEAEHKASIRVNFKTADHDEQSVSGTHLFVALGRQPNTKDLKLENAGIETDEKGYIKVNDYLETTAKGVYAMGDVKGGAAFTHIAYDDFRIIKHNLFNEGKEGIKDRVVPYCVFIDPELGRTGLTEKEASKKGLSYRVAKIPMSAVARAVEMGETTGFMKVLIEDGTDHILGATILGVSGGEIASFIHLAILANIPYQLIRDSPFPHPTLIESLNNLFSRVPE